MSPGDYRLSQTQVLEAIGLSRNWISELDKRNQNRLKALQEKGFRGSTVEITISSESKARRAKTLSLDNTAKIWAFVARSGNEEAFDLLEACTAESLERRADAAFKVQRTEEERNDRLELRRQGKFIRRSLTDAVKAYLERHSEASENYRTWIYKNVTDAVYRAVFAMDAKKLSEKLGCSKDDIRDRLNQFCAARVTWLEESVAQQVDLDCELLEAVKRVVEFNFFIGHWTWHQFHSLNRQTSLFAFKVTTHLTMYTRSIIIVIDFIQKIVWNEKNIIK